MKTCVIYHSRDLDGWMSAAIVLKWYRDNHHTHLINNINTGDELTGFNESVINEKEINSIDFIGYDYNEPIPDLSEYDKVIMSDISFPIEEMEKLRHQLQDKFIWIDHHISAIKSTNERINNYYDGLRDTNYAACELTWMNMNNPINNAVIDLTPFNRYEEKWVDIDNIYAISNYGRILSKEREVNHIGGKAYRPNKILKHIIDAHGYSRVTINGTSERVHRLVAKYFLNDAGETINHIDGNKENNCVSNLEYASYKENNIHAISNGLRNSGFEHWQSNTVEQYKDGKLIKTFGSTTEAAKETGISQGNIAAVCRYHQGIKSKFRNRTQAGGFVFKYKNEVKEETRFERSNLKRTINIGSILSQSNSLELGSTEKEIHKFFNTPEIVRLLGRYDCFGHKGTDEEQKVLEFQYASRAKISNYEEAYIWLIQWSYGHTQSWLQTGKSIYQYLCTEAKQSYKNGFEIIFKPINNKVFLGGTCNNSTWRDELISLLKIKYFNPVVEDWTPECQLNEYKEKELSNIHLYVITKEMTGVFSIAEVIDSVHSNKETIFIVIPEGFDSRQLKSLQAVADMVISHGGKAKITSNINDVAIMINRLDNNTIDKTYKFICINKERFNAINFGIDYHIDGYDGQACFHYANGVWNFSLYSQTVDCSVIAKQFGGGGHFSASGFICDHETFLKIVNG